MRNNFKKIAAIALALVMCVSALVPVFADNAVVICPGEGSVHTATNCTYTVVGTTEADCENNGAVTGKCSVCLVNFAVSTTPALGHKYEVISGDCTTGTRQVCATCGDTQNVAASAGHQWTKYVVEGGVCEEGATATKTCAVCGATAQETMEYDHNWVLVSITKPQSCVTKGAAVYNCGSEGCTATETREVWDSNVDSHAWKTIPAFETTTEVVGGKEVTVTAEEKLNNWIKGLDVEMTLENARLGGKAKAASCLAAGVRYDYCEVCGEIREVALAKTPHHFAISADGLKTVNKTADWATWLASKDAKYVAPTCEDAGKKPYVECNVDGCKAVKTLSVAYTYQIVDGKFDGKTMGWEIDLTKLDEEDLEAITIVTAKTADYEIPATHAWVSEVGTAATCEDEGYYLVTCANKDCDVEEWEYEYEPAAKGHKFFYELSEKAQKKLTDEDKKKEFVKVAALQSCQSEEITEYYCVNGCGEAEEVETKPQLECVADTVYGAESVLPAKCGKAGKKVIVCKMCGDKMGTEEIPALECDLTKKVVTEPATHGEEGYGKYYYACANNDHIEILGKKYKTNPYINEKGEMVEGKLITENKGMWVYDAECDKVDDNDYEIDPLKDTEHVFVYDCWKCEGDGNVGTDDEPVACTLCGALGFLGIDDANVVIECDKEFFGSETSKTLTFRCVDETCSATKNKKFTKAAHSYYAINDEDHAFNEFVTGAIRSEDANVGSCTVARLWEVACKNCFVKYDYDLDEAIDAKAYDIVEDTNTGKGHEYVTVIAKVEPTCTSFGAEEVYYCKNCKDFGTEEKPTGGVDTKTGEAKVIPMLHTFEDDAALVKAIEKAVKKLKYTIVKGDLSNLIPADADKENNYKDRKDYQAWTAYLTADKNKDEADRQWLNEVVIDENLTFVFAVPATCTTAPVLGGFKCTKCNVASLDPDNKNWLPATEYFVNGMDDVVGAGHDLTLVKEADDKALCGVAKYDFYECNVCEAYFLLNYDENEHDFDYDEDETFAWNVGVGNDEPTCDKGTYLAPTCTLEGSASWTCNVPGCGFVKVITVPANGHRTDTGSTGAASEIIKDSCLDRTVDRFCGVCKQTIPMSHKFGDWAVADGVETRQCTDCGTVETKTVDAPVTDAPVTDAPVTDAPVTDAPATEAPETDAPVDEPAKKGCGSSIAAIGVALVATLGTCAVFCGKKED